MQRLFLPGTALALCASPVPSWRASHVCRGPYGGIRRRRARRAAVRDQEELGMATENRALAQWVQQVAEHTQPEKIHWCTGSEEEYRQLVDAMVAAKTLIALDPEAHPRSYLHRSHPTDVARTEHLTFISTPDEREVGPTNNWMSRHEAIQRVWPLFDKAMRKRTMYVVPYLMGPVGSPYSRVGIELTDSAYVAASLRIMTRMGKVALDALGNSDSFVRGLHSLGDLAPERRYIVHFPAAKTIWSIGSGYGGNALLSKKCHALRIASVEARDGGWLAEHMLIAGITNPQGEKRYIAAAFPSACGKTNLAMLVPSLPGWKVETVGDDICWMHVGEDGGLWAVNPEAGMFGVAPGTSAKTNPNALASLAHDAIFTNVALRADGRAWWEGLSELAPGETLTDWRGDAWTQASGNSAAHPNARFTVSLKQCPSASDSADDPRGVPISAIVFGGRRAKVAPLVYEATSFRHGVFVGATMVSETTAAATGAVGVARNDPMAMLPFCGYNMGDYFKHWLTVGQKLQKPPKIFHVNWFRTDDQGKFLWPGFGENIRVLDWILRRSAGTVGARRTPIGLVPEEAGLNTQGLDLSAQELAQLSHVDWNAWSDEAARSLEFMKKFGERLPKDLMHEQAALVARLKDAQA
jgi:phosphoenolpyruvate carboxykinase (GTP)